MDEGGEENTTFSVHFVHLDNLISDCFVIILVFWGLSSKVPVPTSCHECHRVSRTLNHTDNQLY